ncbi:MAG TPA: threonine/serine exporter family protein [Ilumatobacter sp.]|nr:threonine/serine exporter family protein [Ilumatobacter sp.]
MTEPVDAAAGRLDEFLVELGTDLIRSSQTVDDVERQLIEIGRVMGVDGLDVMALPTGLLLESGTSGRLRPRLRSIRERGLRLDQVEGVDQLARRAGLGLVEPADGLAALTSIRGRTPPYGKVVRSVGLGVLAAGFSLALQPTLTGLAFALLLGTAVGAFLAVEVAALAPLTPALMSFVVALVVFGLDPLYEGENPIRFLIPPLLIFLPGAKITTGTMELAAGAIVSGASRLMSGLMDLLLLAVAIVAAATVIGVPQRDLLDRPAPELGEWTLVPALLLIALGYRLHSCAPRRAVPWILLVLAVALTAERVAGLAFDPSIAAFFGAAAMTPVVRAIDRRPNGPRATVLFLPGFYLLVPGATGLIDLTASVSPGFSTADLTSTMVTVAAIALGVLFATAVVDGVEEMATTWRVRRAVDRTVDHAVDHAVDHEA